MIDKILQKLGLSDKEIKIYLSCLKLGPSSVRKIAAEADINRGTTYDILKSLIDLGLISYYHKDKKQYFIAEDPVKLKDVLDQKQQQLKKITGEVDELIPQLKLIYDNADEKPVAKYYDGPAGVKTVLQDVIESCAKTKEKEYYVYSSSAIKSYLYEAYSKFSEDRVKAGINVRVISIGPGGEERGLDERKWLSKDNSTPSYILIYAGKMAMISIDQENKSIGVIIEDKNIYQTQKMIFEFVWDKL